VAILFQFGWPEMRADQRRDARRELDRLVDWCRAAAIGPDGGMLVRPAGESLAESCYFTIAFLDTVGYFDPARRFWTDRAFPDAPAVWARLNRQVRLLHRGDPMARMALDRLNSSPFAVDRPDPLA
jgi:hypothetical protein